MVPFDTVITYIILPYGSIVKRWFYARYERGLREIPVSMLIRLAGYYKTSADYIPGRTDNFKLMK